MEEHQHDGQALGGVWLGGGGRRVGVGDGRYSGSRRGFAIGIEI